MLSSFQPFAPAPTTRIDFLVQITYRASSIWFVTTLQAGSIPLITAVCECHIDIVKLLLQAGADKDAEDRVSRPFATARRL